MLEFLQIYFSQAPDFGWNAFWVSQGLMLVALICDLISWQCKQRRVILLWLTVSTIFIGTHLVLLQEYAAGFLIYIATLRFLTSIFTTNPKFMWGFLGLLLVVAGLLYEKPIDLIALTANIIFNYAAFRPHDKTLRLWTMLGTSIWIFFNLLIFTPAGIFLESVFLLSNIAGYLRFYVWNAKT
jgi:hypothetical protein